MIPSGLKVLLPVMTVATVLASSADTSDQPSSKVMVRGCKATIVQNADADSMLPQTQEDDSIVKSCKTQEEIDLVEAITAQR